MAITRRVQPTTADGATVVHLHCEGAAADHVDWAMTGDDFEDFDDVALERAMLAARDAAYAELATIGRPAA